MGDIEKKYYEIRQDEKVVGHIEYDFYTEEPPRLVVGGGCVLQEISEREFRIGLLKKLTKWDELEDDIPS